MPWGKLPTNLACSCRKGNIGLRLLKYRPPCAQSILPTHTEDPGPIIPSTALHLVMCRPTLNFNHFTRKNPRVFDCFLCPGVGVFEPFPARVEKEVSSLSKGIHAFYLLIGKVHFHWRTAQKKRSTRFTSFKAWSMSRKSRPWFCLLHKNWPLNLVRGWANWVPWREILKLGIDRCISKMI